MTIERPYLMTFIRFHTYLLDSTSNPEVGSSNMINFDPPIRAIPNDNFLFIPPERLEASLN